MTIRQTKRTTLHHLWLGIFAIWLILLSGGLANLLGSPGALQAWQLKNLLKTKQETGTNLHQTVVQLRAECLEMETNRSTQIREIRRVLGYTAPDEIIFDFSHPNPY